jgi:hypothetical protein
MISAWLQIALKLRVLGELKFDDRFVICAAAV